MPDRLNAALDLQRTGSLEEAECRYREIIKSSPGQPDALYLLGTVLMETRRLEEAVQVIAQAIDLFDQHPFYHASLGAALYDLEHYSESAEACRRAINLKPDFAEVHNNLGNALNKLGQNQEALESITRSLELTPDNPNALASLGNAQRALGRWQEAALSCQKALEINPGLCAASSTLALTQMTGLWQLPEAAENFRQTLELNPDFLPAYTDYAGLLTFFADDPLEHARLTRRWYDTFIAPGLPPPPSFPAPSETDRPLRVGYVSGDFRFHAVGFYLKQLFANLDPSAVEIHCYASQDHGDDMTDHIKSFATGWRSVADLSDPEAVAVIRADKIDILIDLSGHTGHGRLGIFARRGAPVQAAWCGYWATTGVAAMDYVIADATIIPERNEDHFGETVLRLPDCYLCYSPPDQDLTPAPPPAIENGYVTFGSLNRLFKVLPQTLDYWAQLLNQVENSKLLVAAPELRTAAVADQLRHAFTSRGIDGNRLIMNSGGSHLEYLSLFNQIDIMLDPLSYNGGVSTFEALWMGVPVVTHMGDRWVRRLGASILRSVGLKEYIAASTEEYVAVAARLAADVAGLARMRAGLRARLLTSPACDGPRFARNMETLYETMWQNHRAAIAP